VRQEQYKKASMRTGFDKAARLVEFVKQQVVSILFAKSEPKA
jgi:hypothetical protein